MCRFPRLWKSRGWYRETGKAPGLFESSSSVGLNALYECQHSAAAHKQSGVAGGKTRDTPFIITYHLVHLSKISNELTYGNVKSRVEISWSRASMVESKQESSMSLEV